MGVVTRNKNAFAVWAGVAVLLAAAAPARAQVADYPSRPITLLVPFVAGGSSDVVMRLVSKRVSERLKQPIVIDNRPGGAGNVAALAIKNAPKDGYTLMMGHTGTHAIHCTTPAAISRAIAAVLDAVTSKVRGPLSDLMSCSPNTRHAAIITSPTAPPK